MAAGCKHKEIVAFFELRFDYQSARTMLSEALRDAGLEAAASYASDEVSAIAASLARLSPDASRVVEALSAAHATDASPPPADEPKADKPKADKPKADEPKADAPPSDDAKPPSKAKAKPKAAKKKAGSKKSSKK